MANKSDKSTKKSTDEKLLEEAHARFKLCVDAEDDIRQKAKEDIEFAQGEQWPIEIREERARDGRPCLTINKIAQSINQITNDQRQGRPAIKVSPVDDNADLETAKIRQGLIRHIEYDSNADAAYATGFEFAVTGGFGFWRIITEYLSPTSFKLAAKIKQIKNPFSVYLDPFHKEPDGSDAEYGFVFEDLSPEQYKNKFKESELSNEDGFKSMGNSMPGWMPNGSVRVAEYFYKEYEEDTLYQLSDGTEVLKSALEEKPELMSLDAQIVNERKTTVAKVRWAKINGCEILEQTDFPGSFIPIVPVYGKDIDIDGKRTLKGIVRDSKDPARMYNYQATNEAEAIALTPRAPFIMAEGQVEGYESIWASANRKNHAYLPYKPKSIDGTPVPPPQRNAIETSTSAITQARMMASEDLKATTGIYDAALGAKSNETSGIAIQRRNAQANTANFHFVDNLNRSIRHTGRILNEIIPTVYDAAQTIRIVGEEGEERVVRINEEFEENGKPVTYAMDVGKFDVTVDSGPSFQTKRQEAVTSMMEFVRSSPQQAPLVMDLLVRNMDWPGATEISERLKKMLPPNLQDQKEQPQVPPEMQQQMQAAQQMVEQLTGKLNELQQEKEMKLIELESKERIEFKKLEVQLEIERAKMDAKDSHALLSAEIDQINSRLQYLDMNEPIQLEQDEPQQNLTQGMDGGEAALSNPEEMQPTGGMSPGQSIEGNSNEQYE